MAIRVQTVTIIKANLRDYLSVKEYDKAIINAGKHLSKLGHPIKSWILLFYFLDGLTFNYKQICAIQKAQFTEELINAPTYDKKTGFTEDIKGYIKIEDLLHILI